MRGESAYEATDPARALASAVLLEAVRDSLAGDEGARRWLLENSLAETLMTGLDIDADLARSALRTKFQEGPRAVEAVAGC